MGNFTRRVIAFIMGMVVMLVTLFGGVAGAMYWAFKNLSLSKLGVMQEDESGIADATIEDLVALVMLVQSDPESFTIKELEKQGIDVLKLLETLGVDLSKADSSDYEALKDISPFLLFSSDGLYEISFSTVFAFLPKGEDGTYPIFSQGARNMLRGYSLGYLMETDYETGQMRLFSELGSLKIGSLFPQTFTETYDGVKGEYIYTADNPAIEKLGNIKVSFITNKVSGEYVFDFGKELHEGDLTEFGDMKLVDLLADLIAGDDEDAKEETKNGLSLLGDVLFKDLFKYDEEAGMYAFDIEALLGELSIGKFMGYAKCTENESCPIHKDVANCDGEWYEKCSNNDSCPIHSDTGCVGKEQYQKYSGDTAEELITKNLIGLDIEAIMGGEFEISTFVEGVYLGHALGYTIASNASSEYCDKNCDLLEDHDHNYYWIDDGGDFVGNLYNDVSNMALINALNGEGIDLEGTVSYSSLGELLGKHKEGDDWYDEDGTPTSNETAMDKIMLSIYDKTMDEMSNGELELGDVLSGIKLGELMGHTLGNKDGYCEANCDNDSEKHKHKYYWLKDGNEVTFTKFDKTLYETNVEELVSGNKDFKAILSGLRVGELMGNSYENGVWYNENNEELELGVLDKTIYEVEVSKLLNNEVDFKETLQHLYVGQLMNYTGSKGAWEKDGKPVSKLNMVMADVQLAEIFDGTFDLKSKVNDLTLGDVLTIDEDTPTVLKILSTSKISKISADMNKLELGEAMGYIKCSKDAKCTVHEDGEIHDGKWYRENENGTFTLVDGLNAKIANYTFESFASKGFDINDFTLGDVITDDREYEQGSIFYLLDVSDIGYIEGVAPEKQDIEKRKSISMEGLSQRIQNDVKEAPLGKLMECGVFSLSRGEQATLSRVFTNAGKGDWKSYTLQDFISTVIGMLG